MPKTLKATTKRPNLLVVYDGPEDEVLDEALKGCLAKQGFIFDGAERWTSHPETTRLCFERGKKQCLP